MHKNIYIKNTIQTQTRANDNQAGIYVAISLKVSFFLPFFYLLIVNCVRSAASFSLSFPEKNKRSFYRHCAGAVMCWMFDIHFESGPISRRGPCLSAPCSWEAGRERARERERERERRKKQINLEAHSRSTWSWQGWAPFPHNDV